MHLPQNRKISSQTFVCSAIDELKYQPCPSCPSSSGKCAGLQWVWQNSSAIECLHEKWKTSTYNPTFSKKGSFLTCLASEQLLSKKIWSGIWPLILNVRLINSCKAIRQLGPTQSTITYCTAGNCLGTIESFSCKNNPTRCNQDLFIVCLFPSKICFDTLFDLHWGKLVVGIAIAGVTVTLSSTMNSSSISSSAISSRRCSFAIPSIKWTTLTRWSWSCNWKRDCPRILWSLSAASWVGFAQVSLCSTMGCLQSQMAQMVLFEWCSMQYWSCAVLTEFYNHQMHI